MRNPVTDRRGNTAIVWAMGMVVSVFSCVTHGLVKVTDNVLDEEQSAFKIETDVCSYYFQKAAGGFSSIVDKNGMDWIDFHPWGGLDGSYRGIPNLWGAFHPGRTDCQSQIKNQSADQVTIACQTNDGQWQCTWDFFATYATFTLTKAGGSYWFLYEGTPNGAFNGSTNYMIRSDLPTRHYLGTDKKGDIAPQAGQTSEWAFFGDKNVKRVLFLIHHEDDLHHDIYSPLDPMTVFGFGRSDNNETLMTKAPSKFTIGIYEDSSYSAVSAKIAQILGGNTGGAGKVIVTPNGGEFTDSVLVRLETDSPGLSIYYTINGQAPNRQSLKYAMPFSLKSTATIKAIAYTAGYKDSTSQATAKFRIIPTIKSVNPHSTLPGLEYRYYEGQWDHLPDFSKLEPVQTGVIEQFKIAPRIRNDYFAFQFEGYIEIPVQGTYTFYTLSDAGSQLYLGSHLVVDNDAQDLTADSGKAKLEEGMHPITVAYFEDTGYAGLVVQYMGPNSAKKEIPGKVLFRDNGSSSVARRLGSSDIIFNSKIWLGYPFSQEYGVSVFRINGSVVQYKKFQGTPKRIQTNRNLGAGVYILSIPGEKSKISRRFFVNRLK